MKKIKKMEVVLDMEYRKETDKNPSESQPEIKNTVSDATLSPQMTKTVSD